MHSHNIPETNTYPVIQQKTLIFGLKLYSLLNIKTTMAKQVHSAVKLVAGASQKTDYGKLTVFCKKTLQTICNLHSMVVQILQHINMSQTSQLILVHVSQTYQLLMD